MLYSDNFFAFREQLDFDLFCSIVPPRHLAKVRNLHIEVMCREYLSGGGTRPPELAFQEEAEWVQFWGSVGQLQGLKTLEVKIFHAPAFWIGASIRKNRLPAALGDSIDLDHCLLGPLRAMMKLDRFQVILPQECQVRLREDDPFQIQCLNIYEMRGSW
jgi:hypothetical protein